ncbi:amino acid ABC transporter substrate-binding protein [Bradyrhizobium cenepequi]
MNLKIMALLAAVAVAVIGSPSARAADPVRIGVAIAQTGPFAPAAVPTLNAYKLWVEQVNASGGLDVAGTKRPIDLVVYDDQSDFTKEATIYEKLITDDKVDLLLSPYSTPAHFAIVGVLERYKFPMVGSTAASSQLKKVKPGNIWFPTSAMPDQMGPEFVKMMKSLGMKSIAFATLQSPFPQEIENYLRAAIKGTDIKVVAAEQFAPDVRDMTSVVSAIKKAKPDAVLSLSFPPQSILYMKAAREQSLDAPLQLVLIGPTHEFFGKMFGKNLNGIVTIGHWSPYQAKWPKAMPFYEAFTKKFGEAPDYLDVPLAYMSCEILQQAVAAAGLDKDKLRATISSKTFDTIDGPVKFEGVQNVATPTMFLQLQDGKAQIVWPKEEATASFKNKSPWAE